MSTPPKHATRGTLELEFTACGKARCGRCGGTRYKHGPYWYFYFQKPDGKTGKSYVGRDPLGWLNMHGTKATNTKNPNVIGALSGHQTTKPTRPATTPKQAKPTKAKPAKQTPKKPTTLAKDHAEILKSSATPKCAARILGLKPGATARDLSKAYRSAIRTHHPDKGGAAEAAAAVNRAHEILKPLCK